MVFKRFTFRVEGCEHIIITKARSRARLGVQELSKAVAFHGFELLLLQTTDVPPNSRFKV